MSIPKIIGQRILVKLNEIKNENFRESSILLPIFINNVSMVGEVIDISDSIEENLGFKIGDKVLIPPNEGIEITHEDVDYLSMRVDDILAIVNTDIPIYYERNNIFWDK